MTRWTQLPLEWCRSYTLCWNGWQNWPRLCGRCLTPSRNLCFMISVSLFHCYTWLLIIYGVHALKCSMSINYSYNIHMYLILTFHHKCKELIIVKFHFDHAWTKNYKIADSYLNVTGHTGKYTQQTNAILEWVLNGQAQLVPPRVLVWDSFLPVSHAALSDCITFLSKNLDIKKLPAYSIFKPEITWHCTERMHVGFEALLVAAQMMINHICNPFMDEKGYCCST